MGTDNVAYVNKKKDGRFSFHVGEGREVVVTADKPYETSDPIEIAYLDSVESVKRVKTGDDGGDD